MRKTRLSIVIAALSCIGAIYALGRTGDLVLATEARINATSKQNTSSQTTQASIHKDATCPFCYPKTIVHYSDDVVQVINKQRPARHPYKTEVLIVPQTHIEHIDVIDTYNPQQQELLIHMFRAAQHMANQLQGEKNYTLEINGPGFYGVPHLHMHFKSKCPLKK